MHHSSEALHEATSVNLAQQVQLPPDPESVPRARKFAERALADLTLDLLDTILIAVSEATTNAVLHAHTDFILRVLQTTGVRVEVEDFSPDGLFNSKMGPESMTGRGLDMICMLSSSCGVEPTEQGKIVWFTFEEGDTSTSLDATLTSWGGFPQARTPSDEDTVVLEGFVPALWFAAQEQHNAFIRELTLMNELPAHILAQADRASLAVMRSARNELSVEDFSAVRPQVLERSFDPSQWEPVRADLKVDLSSTSSADFSALQDVLDHAEDLARSGKLLTSESLPEVVALRDWLCDQVISQVEGAPSVAWRFDEMVHDFYDQSNCTPSDSFDLISSSTRNLMVADKLNRIISVSEPLARLLGWSPSELVGKRISVMTPPRFREAHVAGVTHHLATGERKVLGHPVMMPALRADGTEVYCRFVIDTLPVEQGEVYVAEIDPLNSPPPVRRDTTASSYLDVLASLPTPYLLLTPELFVVSANPAYLKLVGKKMEELKGLSIFDVFPSPLDASDRRGHPQLLASFASATKSGKPDRMQPAHYSVTNFSGEAQECYWSVVNSPLYSSDGELLFWAQEVHSASSGSDLGDLASSTSTGSPRSAPDAPTPSSGLQLLVEAALSLAGPSNFRGLQEQAVSKAVKALGASSGSIFMLNNGDWALQRGSVLPDPLDFQTLLPVKVRDLFSRVLEDGVPLLISSLKANPDPELQEVYAATSHDAWGCFPLISSTGEPMGLFVLSWEEAREFNPATRTLAEAFASLIAQVGKRLSDEVANRREAEENFLLAERLQSSFLQVPTSPLAVRSLYRPSSARAHVGGDWYDILNLTDGSIMISVGDVVGHNIDAAASMAQIRNIFRGAAASGVTDPAEFFRILERAMEMFDLRTLATATAVRAERSTQGWSLQTSNAGHPPVLVVAPDTRVDLLDGTPDPLLGLESGTVRTSSVHQVPAGSKLILYSDGLVEDRNRPLDDGISLLKEVLRENCNLPASELLDLIPARLTPSGEDDLVLVIVQL